MSVAVFFVRASGSARMHTTRQFRGTPSTTTESLATLTRPHGSSDIVIRMLRELLATDERRALEFFLVHLRDVCEPSVARDELLYNASVLAHYAQVSTATTVGMPMLGGLVPYRSVRPRHDDARGSRPDGDGGGAVPHPGGFLRGSDAPAARGGVVHRAGGRVFSSAAAHQESEQKARLLHALSRHFEQWRQRHAR